MNYRCTACDHRFTADEPESSRRLRCPACMRRSSVVTDQPVRSGAGAWLRRGLLALAALTIVAGLAVAAWSWWPTDRDAGDGTGRPTPQLPDTQRLDEPELAAHRTILDTSGAEDAADTAFGSHHGVSPRQAALMLSTLLREQIELGQLYILDEAPRRRGPLAPEILADGTLAAIVAREGAYLHPVELTLLVSALLNEVEVSHDFVLLEPLEPTSARLPVVAVRILLDSDDDTDLALDPQTGALRAAPAAEGHGASLPWAELALIEARRAVQAGDFDRAAGHIDRAARLEPDLWTVRATRVELALARDQVDEARALADGLAEVGDHPRAWLLEARAELAGNADTDARLELEADKLAAIVEAFVAEADLAVTLGERLVELGRLEEARDTFELALSRDPDVVGAHTGLARLYAGSDPARAHDHLRAELGRHPGHVPAYLALGALDTMYGHTADAERTRERGRAIAPDVAAFERAWTEHVQ